MSDTLTLHARLEVYLQYLFSSGTLHKKCYCGPGKSELVLGETLKLLGAKQGYCELFEFTNGVFRQKVGPCTNGVSPEKAEAYWQEFIDEVVSLVGE